MKKIFKQELETYCTLHWWNIGKKTLSFKGNLSDLLKRNNVSYSIRKTDNEFVYQYIFKNSYGITFKAKATRIEFPFLAKQFLQMEFCRMGDKVSLYVQGVWGPTVTVNF